MDISGAFSVFNSFDNPNTLGLKGAKISLARSDDSGMRIKASHFRYKDTMDVTTSTIMDDIDIPGCNLATLIFALNKMNEYVPLGSENIRNSIETQSKHEIGQ